MFKTEVPQQSIAVSVQNSVPTPTDILLEVERITEILTGHRPRESLIAPHFCLVDTFVDSWAVNVGTDYISIQIVEDSDQIHCLIGHKTIVDQSPLVDRRLLCKSDNLVPIQTDVKILVVVCLIGRSITHNQCVGCTNGRVCDVVSKSAKAFQIKPTAPSGCEPTIMFTTKNLHGISKNNPRSQRCVSSIVEALINAVGFFCTEPRNFCAVGQHRLVCRRWGRRNRNNTTIVLIALIASTTVGCIRTV